MKLRLFLVALLANGLLLSPAHSREASAAPDNGKASPPIVITDFAGRQLSFDAPVERIITLLPSLTEAVCALQACDRLVAVGRHSDWPRQVQSLPRLGGLNDTSVESIVRMRPDVVLLSPATRIAGRLESLGIRTVILDALSIDDVRKKLQIIAALVGQPERATGLWQAILARLSEAASSVPDDVAGRSVYFEVSPEPYAAGAVSFVGEMLARLKLKNIVPAELGPFPRLNPEFIVRADPQIIMAGRVEIGRMAHRPGWAGMAALRNESTCGFTDAEYRWLVRPGPRLGDGMSLLAQCLVKLTDAAPERLE